MTGFDLTVPRSILVVGAGGPGMSALAIALSMMGHRVRGTDIKETAYLDTVRAAGVEVHIGHAPSHLDGVDVVTVSTAIPPDHLEVRVARERGIPVVSRATMLAAVVGRARGIGIAGTHGKTTTTSLLTLILREAGLNPSFIIGGQVNEIGAGASWTGGEWIVVEADESDDTFRALPLEAAVLTNVEPDHLENWGTFDALVEAFGEFLGTKSGPVVVCADDPIASRLGRQVGARTYGQAEGAAYRIVNLVSDGGVQRFTILRDGSVLGAIELPLRGEHMAANATAAVAMAVELGVPFAAAARTVAKFGGVARRFEFRGEVNGAALVDDYAHLPGEIAAVLKAAHTSGDGWRRVVAVFQPNRYRRMAILAQDYRDAFVDANVVVLTDIYPSGDDPIPGVTGKLVVDAVLDAHPTTELVYVPRRSELSRVVASLLRAGDVCISMGCGDIATLPDEMVSEAGRRVSR